VVLLFWLVYICFGYFCFSSFIPFHIILFNFIVLFNFYIKYNTHSFKYCFFNPFLDLFFFFQICPSTFYFTYFFIWFWSSFF
jgi:hypothetical protein